MRRVTEQEMLARKRSVEEVRRKEKMDLVVILDDIRSRHNVGSIFRTADAIGAKRLMLCGITGFPPDVRIEKTALGAVETVEFEGLANVKAAIGKCRAEGRKVLAVEQCTGSLRYDRMSYELPLAIILGNEVSGVSQEALDLVDGAVWLPMEGRASSLNVANAFAVIGYKIFEQNGKSKDIEFGGNQSSGAADRN